MLPSGSQRARSPAAHASGGVSSVSLQRDMQSNMQEDVMQINSQATNTLYSGSVSLIVQDQSVPVRYRRLWFGSPSENGLAMNFSAVRSGRFR